jgi:hypothetical protein
MYILINDQIYFIEANISVLIHIVIIWGGVQN